MTTYTIGIDFETASDAHEAQQVLMETGIKATQVDETLMVGGKVTKADITCALYFLREDGIEYTYYTL